MSLARIEAWIVRSCEEVLAGRSRWHVQTGPGEWSEDYLRRVVQHTPAAVVAFHEAVARDDHQLTLDTRWSIFVLGRMPGQDRQASRVDADAVRGGTDAGTDAWPSAELIAGTLHHCEVRDAAGNRVGAAGVAMVSGIENLWSGTIDKRGLALAAIAMSIPLAIDPAAAAAELAALEGLDVDWDLRPGGAAVDAEQTINLEES